MHAPQFFASLDVSMHLPLHETVPASQAHTPALQATPAGHAFPHCPQLAVSVLGSTQVGGLPQACFPASQAPHWPWVQAVPGHVF